MAIKNFAYISLICQVTPGLRDVWGPAVAQKYIVHQNAPFKKIQTFSPSVASLERYFGPHCGYRRACTDAN